MKKLEFEEVIFQNLIHNERYTRAVSPFLKDEYFGEQHQKVLFKLIINYFTKYNKKPTTKIISIDLDSEEINQDTYDSCIKTLNNIDEKPDDEYDWLIETTEKFCQDKAIYNAFMKGVKIIDGKSKQTKEVLPELMKEALSVSFDSHIGHDYFEDIEERYDFYHKVEERIPFDIERFNKITKNGTPRKTLNIILAGTNVGKSLMMCSFATSNLMMGKNVLYITLEMAEERISERIDANILNTPLDDIEDMPKETYIEKVEKAKKRAGGKMIVKEYPTSSVGVGHFRHLLNELRTKKNFSPDIIYVDYINLCISSRIKMGGNGGSYEYIKAIAEELRGLAVEFDVPIWTATQTNRSGFSSSDIELTDTAESFGLPATCDFMIAVINTDEFEQIGQLMIKQLKNRYRDKSIYKKFMVGVDRPKMRIFNVEQNAQENIGKDINDTPVMDNTGFGQALKAERGWGKNKFEDWK